MGPAPKAAAPGLAGGALLVVAGWPVLPADEAASPGVFARAPTSVLPELAALEAPLLRLPAPPPLADAPLTPTVLPLVPPSAELLAPPPTTAPALGVEEEASASRVVGSGAGVAAAMALASESIRGRSIPSEMPGGSRSLYCTLPSASVHL